MKKFNYNEIVVLNPLQTRYQLFSSRVLVPRYVATSDGIYRANVGKRMKTFFAIYGTVIGIAVLVFVVLFGMIMVYSGFTVSFSNPIYLIPTLIGVGIIIGGVFGIVKLVKIGKRFGRIINDIEGELVIPWSQVKSIVVMNARQENVANRPSLTLNIIAPTYKEIGDWHVLTVDGRDITIPNVDDPYNKLVYVKNRFNLNFS
ncbi:conjugative plasmid protein (pARN3) [Sulfuracidifex metallicus]|uniref:Conjugative plasmid protein (PARN3) n=1 Tax=Sulfuracidifex metallicus DSM 6482 = JCM 9184 TaxID=523847 RepID=A0A6A9QKJ0_SULME|nr:conjugative plasmid protein (pARN3) [Sulfuracidifex metallicus]MUN29124.1 conjugative plasmid protein (pARN3) [Sulfuracidifex metallicus DSM 6482 = JCM 9184]